MLLLLVIKNIFKFELKVILVGLVLFGFLVMKKEFLSVDLFREILKMFLLLLLIELYLLILELVINKWFVLLLYVILVGFVFLIILLFGLVYVLK